jgi:endonuclease/exonuclease/phosphatase family metal-dependent hydrolase
VGQRAKVVLASYNIRRCLGRDGIRKAERIGTVLAALSADVIGVQEVDSEAGEDRPGTLEALARAAGMEAVAGPAMRRADGGYGNGLLSRLPIEDVRRHDLSYGTREPRGALEVTLRAGGTPLTVVTTHLGLNARERRRQTRSLLARITAIDTPILVVMGDFNAWTPLAPFRRAMRGMLGATPAPRTFPSGRPLLALDRIWVRPVERLREMRAVRTPLTRVASDHLPLVATVALATDTRRSV